MGIQLTYLGGSSGDDGCPALYAIDGLPEKVADGKEWVMVQGKVVTDADVPPQLVGLQANENFVMIPKDLIRDHLDTFEA